MQYDETIESARSMIAADFPDDKMISEGEFSYKEEAYYLIVSSYRNMEDFDNLLKVTEEAYKKYPDSIYSNDFLFIMGVTYMDEMVNTMNPTEALDKAAVYFDEYIEKFPGTANYYAAIYYQGYAYFNNKDFDKAIKSFDMFVRIFPNHDLTADAAYLGGEAKYNLGQFDEAIESYTIVHTKWPDKDRADDAMYNHGWALVELNRKDESIEIFRRFIDRYPDSDFAASTRFTMGDFLYNDGKYEEAIEEYQKVLEDYPDDDVAEKVPELLQDLKETIAYIDYEKAFKVFADAKKTEDPELFEQAVEMFQDIATKHPGTDSEVGSYANMGFCYETLEQWREAAEAYKKVMDKYEEGLVDQEAYKFAKDHRDWIEKNRL